MDCESYNVGNVAKNAMQYETLGEARKRELLQYLAEYLIEESELHGRALPPVAAEVVRDGLTSAAAEKLWLAFRSLANVRPSWPAPAEFLAAQDELLQGLIAEAGIATLADTTASPVDPRLRLWRGDITTLAVDAIVNAANSGMTGCWAPLHYCIDNAIHTFAGVQLRLKCAQIMREQGYEEPVGRAKVTPAYNLPSHNIIHTVGPMTKGNPTLEQRKQLTQCYISCLDAACAAKAKSVAFCCISTGVFGFPQQEGAQIAVQAVKAWLDSRAADEPGADMHVIFDVYTEQDENFYRAILGEDEKPASDAKE